MLINESTFEEMMNAHTERAFTWRQLVRALHQRDCLPAWRTREVNRFAECGEGNGRENMEILTLPGPAGELWAAKREVIHSLPAEVFGQPIRPHIGGGTTLAARWKHRLSTDIDILLPGRNTLIDLLQDDERNVVRRLGGEPEAVTDRRAKIAFTRGRSTVAS